MEHIDEIDLRLLQLQADLLRLIDMGLIEPKSRPDGQVGYQVTTAGRAQLARRA
jgi:hypothetical protein